MGANVCPSAIIDEKHLKTADALQRYLLRTTQDLLSPSINQQHDIRINETMLGKLFDQLKTDAGQQWGWYYLSTTKAADNLHEARLELGGALLVGSNPAFFSTARAAVDERHPCYLEGNYLVLCAVNTAGAAPVTTELPTAAKAVNLVYRTVTGDRGVKLVLPKTQLAERVLIAAAVPYVDFALAYTIRELSFHLGNPLSSTDDVSRLSSALLELLQKAPDRPSWLPEGEIEIPKPGEDQDVTPTSFARRLIQTCSRFYNSPRVNLLGGRIGFGFVSSANIGHKNWASVWFAGHTVVGLSSRDVSRAEAMITTCQKLYPFEPFTEKTQTEAAAEKAVITPTSRVTQAFSSIDDLLSMQGLDVVYIPAPTTLRLELVKKCAEKKKHVICEKPCGATFKEVQEMVDVCRANGVQFMDGTMLSHGVRIKYVLREVKHSIGQLRHVHSNFSFNAGEEFLRDNLRVKPDLDPLGALGDLGWYNIRYTLHILNWQLPLKVTATCLRANEAGVPLEFQATLVFPPDAHHSEVVVASFYCSFLAANQQTLIVSGTKGVVTVDDFCLPFLDKDATRFSVTNHETNILDCRVDYVNKVRQIEIEGEDSCFQESQMIRDMATIAQNVKAKKPEALSKFWPEASLKTQAVLEACLQSSTSGGAEVVLSTIWGGEAVA